MIDSLVSSWREAQIQALKQQKCSSEVSMMLSRIFTDFERINDHALNVSQEFDKITYRNLRLISSFSAYFFRGFCYNLVMNIEKLLNTIIEAGKMLVESGAEVNRVEETMVRMCRCFEGIEYADSYVTLTGIMFSLTYENKTITRICRVHTGEVDLNRIDQINTLSRRICSNPISVDELANELGSN